MNRKIKFRAWIKVGNSKGKMYDWEYITNPNLNRCEQYPSGAAFGLLFKCFDNYHKECVLMQFTGQQDIKGKDIYEGDIVEHPFYANIMSGVVVYNDSHSGFLIECPRGINISDLSRNGGSVKVVGNIYENPNLLNNEIVTDDLDKWLTD